MDIHFVTSKGGRDYNEDFTLYQIKDDKGIFVLADGLGGHASGDLAAQTVCQAVINEFLLNSTLSIKDYIETAQNALKAKQEESFLYSDMMTTIVVLLTDGNTAFVAHSGDSRLYHIRNNKVLMRTRDHSLVQAMVDLGKIKSKDVREHPDRNKVLYSLGGDWDAPQYEVGDGSITLGEKDVFILCTDGWWEYITEKEMLGLLKKTNNIEEWLLEQEKLLIRKVKAKAKNNDNYTALAVKF